MITAERGEADLAVGAAGELPEVLHPAQQGPVPAAAVERVALGAGALEPHLMGAMRQGDGEGCV